MDGTKATGIVCETLRMGKPVSIGENVIVTDRCVWSTTLDKKKMAELSHTHKDKIVNYCPHPLLAISSSTQPYEKNTLLIISSARVTEWIERFSNHMIRRGYDVVAKCITELSTKEATRLCKKASFIIYDRITSSNVVYPAISVGTPFFLFNSRCSDTLDNVLRLCNLTELVSNATSYEQFKLEIYEVYINRDKVRELLLEVSRSMKNVISWVKRGRVSMTRGQGPVLIKIDMEDFRDAVLTPWIGIIDSFSEAPSSLSSSQFVVSSLVCVRILVYTEAISEVVKSLSQDCEVCVVRPMILSEPPLFDMLRWKKNKNMVLVSNSIIMGSMTTAKTHPVTDVPGDTVLVLSSEDSRTREKWVKWCISRRVPVVTRICEISEACLGENYPLYLDTLYPDSVIEICTDKNIREAVRHISECSHSSPEEYIKSI